MSRRLPGCVSGGRVSRRPPRMYLGGYGIPPVLGWVSDPQTFQDEAQLSYSQAVGFSVLCLWVSALSGTVRGLAQGLDAPHHAEPLATGWRGVLRFRGASPGMCRRVHGLIRA